LDKELFDKGLKILKSDGSATVIEKLSPKVLRIKAITIALLAETACIWGSNKNAGLANHFNSVYSYPFDFLKSGHLYPYYMSEHLNSFENLNSL